jgi:hypothetical protein
MSTITSRRTTNGGFLALVLVTAVLSGACSSTPQVCKDLHQLDGSVQALKDVNVASGSLATLQSKLSTVQTDLAAVKQSAAQAVGPEVSALSASLQTVKQSIQTAVATPGVASIAAVVSAVGAAGTAFTALKSAVPSC